MKERIFLLLICVISVYTINAQNYIYNSGFEQGKSNIFAGAGCSSSTASSHCPSPTNGLIVSYYDNCPGGYGTVSKKMANWRDRMGEPYNCSCFSHSPDWLYNGYYDGSTQGPSWTCPVGNGCIRSDVYELFQQNINALNRKIKYRLSTKMRIHKYNSSSPSVVFFLSGGEVKYNDENSTGSDNCFKENQDWQSYVPPLALVNRKYMSYPLDGLITAADGWKTLEFPIDLTNHGTFYGQGYDWFGVDINGPRGSVWVGFDEMYIDEEGCFCPYDREISNVIITGYERLRAQHNLTISNTSVNTPSGVTAIITAGNEVELLDGFSTNPNSSVDIHIAGCYDDDQPITVPLLNGNPQPAPTAFSPNCDGINDEFCMYTKGATSYKLVWCPRWGGANCKVFEGNIDVGDITSEWNKTCLPVPVALGVNEVYVCDIYLYGCNGQYQSSTMNVTVLNPTPGCANSFKQDLNETIPIRDSVKVSSDVRCSLYPNPSCNKITVEITNNLKNVTEITVLDINGRKLKTINTNSEKTEIEIGNLTDGNYLVHIKDEVINQLLKFNKICNH